MAATKTATRGDESSTINRWWKTAKAGQAVT